MHITGGTRYQRLLKQGRLRRRKVATNEDPTNAQPVRNIACPGEELKLMFIFASSITKVIKTPISPRGMASTKQTTRASTGDLAATGESTQSVFIAVSKVSFLSRTLNVVARRHRTHRAKRTKKLVRRCHPRRVRFVWFHVVGCVVHPNLPRPRCDQSTRTGIQDPESILRKYTR